MSCDDLRSKYKTNEQTIKIHLETLETLEKRIEESINIYVQVSHDLAKCESELKEAKEADKFQLSLMQDQVTTLQRMVAEEHQELYCLKDARSKTTSRMLYTEYENERIKDLLNL